MFIIRIFSIFITVITMACAAHADKLDPKWADFRATANHLGDLAKAGDKAALIALNEFADDNQAQALHNLGWLNRYGYGDTPSDYDKSCDYYQAASKLDYPPSQHAFALCLYRQAENDRLSGPEDWEDTRFKADILMLEAAEAGWVSSAIYVSGDLMNRFDFILEYAVPALVAVKNGLKSNPNDKEKRDLMYMKAIAIIYSHEPRDFKVAEEALFMARDKGHTEAVKVMPLLYNEWGKKIGDKIDKWKPDIAFARNCFDNARDKYFNISALSICNGMYLLKMIDYTVVHKDVYYLHNRVADLLEVSNDRLAISRKKIIDQQIAALKLKKQEFDEAVAIIDEKFMPLYRARKEAGE